MAQALGQVMAFVPRTVTTAQLSSLAWAAPRRRWRNSDRNKCIQEGVPQILVDSGRLRILVFARVPMGWNESKCEIGHCGCETLKPSLLMAQNPLDLEMLTRLSLSRCLVFSSFLVVSLPRCFAMHPGGAWSLDASRLWSSGTSATVWHGTSTVSTVWHCCNLLRFCQTFAFKHSEHSAACCIMILIHIVSVQVPVAVVRLWTRDDSPDTGLSQKPRNLSWDLSGLLSGCSVDASVVCLMDLHSIYSCTILHYLALSCTLYLHSVNTIPIPWYV